MAKEESDREDLMREATALRERVEIRLPGEAETVIVGRKRTGDVSVYLGAAPVYHFNAEGQLRRAFTDGYLYRTQGNTLARLLRERATDATILRRHDLSGEELRNFLATMQGHLIQLAAGLNDGSAEVVQQIPEESFPWNELREFLENLVTHDPELAPGIPGKR